MLPVLWTSGFGQHSPAMAKVTQWPSWMKAHFQSGYANKNYTFKIAILNIKEQYVNEQGPWHLGLAKFVIMIILSPLLWRLTVGWETAAVEFLRHRKSSLLLSLDGHCVISLYKNTNKGMLLNGSFVHWYLLSCNESQRDNVSLCVHESLLIIKN